LLSWRYWIQKGNATRLKQAEEMKVNLLLLAEEVQVLVLGFIYMVRIFENRAQVEAGCF
jgi:hypothetical protein